MARASLANIAAHVAVASQEQQVAEAFVARLRGQCEKLASLPGTLGRPRPELGPELRSFPYRAYVIVFRYQPNTVETRQETDGRFAEGDL